MEWTQLKAIVGVLGALITGVLANVLGSWDTWLKALVLFVVLDYLTGLMAAFVNKELSSEIGFKGVVKKVFIFCLIAVAYQVDLLLGTEVIRIAVIGFYLGTEGLSIVENALRTGVPAPEGLKNALIQIKGAEKNANTGN